MCVELRARFGISINPGNVYRELSKLSAQGMIEPTENPSNADPRRNPYEITVSGRRTFDTWLRSPSTQDDELSSWLGFLDRIPPDECTALLDRLQERLWLRSKTLTQSREDALARARLNGLGVYYDVAAVRSLFQLKQLTAVIEFVEELRQALPLSAEQVPIDDKRRRPKR